MHLGTVHSGHSYGVFLWRKINSTPQSPPQFKLKSLL
uniref:Uncharacterized protein n=1 Tax=Anguilla anguilla TaxID=7936 RepID=A0A0E9RWN4_ANGAN